MMFMFVMNFNDDDKVGNDVLFARILCIVCVCVCACLRFKTKLQEWKLAIRVNHFKLHFDAFVFRFTPELIVLKNPIAEILYYGFA